MPDEPTTPRSLTPSPRPEEIAARSFPSARKGLDPDAVRRYLHDLGVQLNEARRREEELARRLDEAKRATPTEQPLDEATLTAALGAETARVLHTAHEAARDIVAKAERHADALVGDAEAAIAERTRHVENEANAMITRARGEASTFLEATREQARSMVDEARDARRRILSDLVERRKSLHVQIEQLRAGKDSLTEVLDSVSGSIVASVDAVRARLDGAEQQARGAATDAGRDASLSDIEELGIGDLGHYEPPVLHVDLPSSIEDLPAARSVPHFDRVEDEAPGAEAPAAAQSESAPEPTEAPSGQGETTGGIDELFARIRASRQQEIAAARAAVAEAEREMLAHDVAEPSAFAEAFSEAGTLVAPPDALEPAAESLPEPVPEAPAEIEEVVEEPASPAPAKKASTRSRAAVARVPKSAALDTDFEGDDFQLLVRRDQLLGPSTAELGRALKRTLRLEQNELLDAVRNLKQSEDAHALLPEEPAAQRVAESAIRGLEAAWLAGESFVGDILGGQGPARLLDASERDAELAEISRLLALEIVDPIRRRMESGLDRSGDDPAAVGAAVGAAFRDWKGSKVESLAGDYATRAFARATLQASRSRGSKVRWLVDDGETRCPDCDDNALAGVVVAGAEFPTGHTHPPIHPGCRCVVVPVQR